MLAAFLIDSGTKTQEPEAIYFSLIAIGGGLGLIASYAVEKKALQKGEDTE